MNKVKKFFLEIFILLFAIIFTLLFTRHCAP